MIELKSGTKIGSGEKPFIIAEVGSCWESWEHCKDAINLAKNCGADAVKFQYFTPKDLYGISSFPFQSGVSPYLHHGWLEGLKQKADAAGIELMCSAFSVEGVKLVDKFVNIHKLASSENNHLRMLEALRDTGKPVIVSNGGTSDYDLSLAICVLNGLDYKSATIKPLIEQYLPIPNERAIPLHCVSDYPARSVDLTKIRGLIERYGIAGYSDHTTDVLNIPSLAVANGACVIEKHVNFFDVKCDDSPHSLSREEFRQMCSKLKGLHYSESGQKEMTLKHKRRLIATKDISVGDKFIEGENFGIYRSTVDDAEGMHPFNVGRLNSKTASVDIKEGQAIKLSDFNKD